MIYTAIFNPNPEEYKRVILEGGHNPSFGFQEPDFYTDPHHDHALISPPSLVDLYIRKQKHSTSYIKEVQDPDPSKYPEHIAMRIRGEVPQGIQFADELTDMDPRFHKASNSLLLSFDYLSKEEQQSRLNEEGRLVFFGNPAPINTIKKMGESSVIDLTWEGNKSFPGYPVLLESGERLENEFGAEVRYGGSFYTPSESHPHGRFGISTIYALMDEFDPDIEEQMRSWFVGEDSQYNKCHEFETMISEDDEDINIDVNIVRAWWD